MMGILYAGLAWLLDHAIARILVGAGLTLITSVGIDTAFAALLNSATSGIGSSGYIGLLQLGGVGAAMSIVGSAMLTRVALNGAGRIIGARLAT